MSILTSIPKQFTLSQEGMILWQPDMTNPLPGGPVAKLSKGEFALAPSIEVLEADDKDAVCAFLKSWMMNHIATTLEPLVRLMTEEEGVSDSVKTICAKLFHNLGIMPRHDLEDQIAALDPEGRKKLRDRKVRLGPILVFLPDLNKPAAVRMRALLWSLYHGRALPAPLPKDGVVSFPVDPLSVDPDFQRAIGYPVYGPRMVRIDMLDRVISAVYDNAKDGQFQAQHQMAEWMGCKIPDLYSVLEAMGHVKVNDPAEQKALELTRQQPSDGLEETSQTITQISSEAGIDTPPEMAVLEALSAETVATETPTNVVATVKPELATFRLRRSRPSVQRPPREKQKFDPSTNKDKPVWKDKNKAHSEKEGDKKDFKKDFKKDRPHKNSGKHSGKHDRDVREDRVISAHAPVRDDDSPFSVLQNLKLK